MRKAMGTWNEMATWGLMVTASLGLHALAFGEMGGRLGTASHQQPRRSTVVEMTIAEVKAAPPVAKAPDEAPPPPRQLRAPTLSRTPRSVTPRKSPAASPSEAEPLADFTGVTLTNTGAGAAGWASQTGNGQAMDGAIGRPGARVSRRVVDGDAGMSGPGSGPPVVGESDLSRRPTAPDLTLALGRAYPEDARRRALAGKAVVRALILPDGHLTRASVQLESAAGFGAACLRTLYDSLWSPPLDRSARAVSTFITYTCRFEVQ